MDVSVITVTWISAAHIARQIASVQEAFAGQAYQHIIVDNNSTDATVEIIKTAFPEVFLIENKENRGFAAANNQGAHEARGEFVLFLNPDMEVNADSMRALTTFLKEHYETVLVGCRLLTEEGRERPALLPTRFPNILQMLVLLLKIPVFFPGIARYWTYNIEASQGPIPVDTVRGSCLMTRRSFIQEVGFAFDERFFLWFEDVDICREAKRLQKKTYYLSQVSCTDHMGQSFKQINHVQRQRQFLKSAVVYFDKWHPYYQVLLIRLLSPLNILVVWLYVKMHGPKLFGFRHAIER